MLCLVHFLLSLDVTSRAVNKLTEKHTKQMFSRYTSSVEHFMLKSRGFPDIVIQKKIIKLCSLYCKNVLKICLPNIMYFEFIFIHKSDQM